MHHSKERVLCTLFFIPLSFNSFNPFSINSNLY
nr:MAG TPA: hypothetical protein [Caudoviricetes sp.]